LVLAAANPPSQSSQSQSRGCPPISHNKLTRELRKVVCGGNGASPCPAAGVGQQGTQNGGLGLNMWATIVSRDGVVCDVTYSGPTNDDQFPGSRVISAQKANTANSFSLDNLALSTAQLYGMTQPGGSLYNLAFSNLVDPAVAYAGSSASYGLACDTSGRASDGMCGLKIGGIITFGGGLGLYNSYGKVIGGLGVSGDTACADHMIAWRLRDALCLDWTPTDDNIVFDDTPVISF